MSTLHPTGLPTLHPMEDCLDLPSQVPVGLPCNIGEGRQCLKLGPSEHISFEGSWLCDGHWIVWLAVERGRQSVCPPTLDLAGSTPNRDTFDLSS